MGYAAASLKDDFSINESEWLSKHAEEMGVELIMTIADDDPQRQLSDVESLITKGAQVIIIRAVDSEAIVPACEAAQNAGVKIIFLETAPGDETKYDVSIGLQDQGEHGRLLGEYLKEWLAEDESRVANVGYINGMVDPMVDGRKTGIFEVCEEAVLVSEQIGGWVPDKAMSITEDWLESHPEINVIACMNDEMAAGAIQALAAAEKSFDDYIVLGVDGSSTGQQYIRSGELKATTYQNIEASTKCAMETAVGLIGGEQFDKVIEPENMLTLMTLDNIDEVTGSAD